jgi:glycolate oxidase FAD binding subunit
MSSILKPGSAEELRQIVEWALAEGTPLAVQGRGSKRALRPALAAQHVLSLENLAGVLDYQPEELVLTAHAGTRLSEIEALLAQRNQMLAFEPPDLGAILGGPPDEASIGGTLACNLAGPRRLSAGAARDHFLGFQAVNGRAERFKSGGKVVKNVTGYDLSKLMAGSRGTLAVLDEVTVKVLPAPESTATMLIAGLGDDDAIALLCAAMGSPHEVSGAAHLPMPAAGRSGIDAVREIGGAITALRVEGVPPSVEARCGALEQAFGSRAPVIRLDTLQSRGFWRELRDARPLWRDGVASTGRTLWRLSVPPAAGAAVVAAIRLHIPGAEVQYDWSGGLVWLSLPAATGNPSASVDTALAAIGGHASLIVGPPALHAARVSADMSSPLGALSQRIRESFDPKGIFAR